MSVILQFYPESLYFEAVPAGSQSVVQTVRLYNTGSQTAGVVSARIPVNFLGKYSTDFFFAAGLSGVTLGKRFSPGYTYYQATDGTITSDAAQTGVVIGIANADGSLSVDFGAQDYILDESGEMILDESGDPLIAETGSGGGGGFFP